MNRKIAKMLLVVAFGWIAFGCEKEIHEAKTPLRPISIADAR